MEKEPATVTSLWPIIVVVAMAGFIVLTLARPCEAYRLRTTVLNGHFGWTNTICYPAPYAGCQCTTVEDDPWTITEGGPAMRQSEKLRRPEIKMEVVF